MRESKICDMNRLPIGLLGFENIRKSNMIYIDKTDLIYQIASQRSPIFFSRPRRFGKSLLVNTLSSLFLNGLEFFHNLYIEKIWNDKKYRVVKLDFSRFAGKKIEKFKGELSDKIIREFNAEGIALTNAIGIRDPDSVLDEILQKVPDNSTVLLIDEYDAPLTRRINEPDDLKEVLDVLSDFYAAVKEYSDKFRLIFITGVTRASHVSIFSAFNNLVDLSLDKEFNALLGFRQFDLKQHFDLYVENAAKVLQMEKREVYRRLEQYYDGYQFSIQANESLYNPWSIMSFFKLPENAFKNYWFESGGMSSLIMQYLKISEKFDFLNYDDREIYISNKDLSNYYEINTIPHEILLYQTGYLTIEKSQNNTAHLTMPNAEVEDSLFSLYLVGNELKPRNDIQLLINDIHKYIDKRDLSVIIKIFNGILNDCVSILSKIFQDERSVRDLIYAALPQEIYLEKIKERESAKGWSDLELITRQTHMIIEFKRTTPNRKPKECLKEAVEQIKCKEYGIGAFERCTLYRVAMVISTEERKMLPDFCIEVV